MRGLAFGPHGTLFVAEAGTGKAPCGVGTGFNCYGHTGAITPLEGRAAARRPACRRSRSSSARARAGARHRVGRQGTQPSVLGEEGALVTIGLEMTSAARNAAGRSDMGRLVHIPIDALRCVAALHELLDEVADVAGGINPPGKRPYA